MGHRTPRSAGHTAHVKEVMPYGKKETQSNEAQGNKAKGDEAPRAKAQGNKTAESEQAPPVEEQKHPRETRRDVLFLENLLLNKCSL